MRNHGDLGNVGFPFKWIKNADYSSIIRCIKVSALCITEKTVICACNNLIELLKDRSRYALGYQISNIKHNKVLS